MRKWTTTGILVGAVVSGALLEPPAARAQGASAGLSGTAVRPYLESFPLPNSRALGTTRGELVTVGTRTTDEHYVMARLDRQFGPDSRAFVHYTFDDGEVVNPSRVNTGETTKTRVHFLTVEHDAVRGSNFVNRAQFGLSRSRLDGFDYVLEGARLPRQTFTEITRGIGAIAVTGLAPWGGNTTNPKLQTFAVGVHLSGSTSTRAVW